MADRKRKTRDESRQISKKSKFRSSSKALKKNGGGDKGKNRRTGPRLPNSLRKEIEFVDAISNGRLDSDQDEQIAPDEGNDVYEYEEEVPEEEARKNRRFDTVENYEYELPEQFEDENVQSDDDYDEHEGGSEDERNKASDSHYHGGSIGQIGDAAEEDDGGRHSRMLQGITGLPSATFEGKKKSENAVISEAYPESEFNPSRDVLDGGGHITIQDLLEPLQGKSGYNQIKKRVSLMQSKSMALHAPLPKPDREKLERKAVKEVVSKEFNKWVPLVKRNREAPTVYFNRDFDVGFSTVGAIASEFEPRTEFEKKMASILHDDKVLEAHKEDGARLLELNEVSVEDHIKARNHIAKMRSLLFRHELKSKRIKKIKSKTYHRLKNKDEMKSGTAMLMDSEAANEEAMKLEFKRAEERMTLRHKNKSKWAKRMLKLGLNVRDEGTRAAIAEQLQLNASLTRKMNSLKNDSGSDDSDDEEEFDDASDSDQDVAAKLLSKAKEKTLKVLEDDDDESRKSGVLSLPFMVRGMKKKNEEAIDEAKRALKEYEELEGTGAAENSKLDATISGRRVFGAAVRKEAPKELKNKIDSDNFYDNSGSDNEMDGIEDYDLGNGRNNVLEKDADADIVFATKDTRTGTMQDSEKIDDIVGNPASKTTFDVAIFASGSWKKMKDADKLDANNKHSPEVAELTLQDKDLDEAKVGQSGDSDSEEEQMVDGILSSAPKETYRPPSQAELISQAFTGDDVVDEFERAKQEILNEENPEPEKPVLIPGWGQWTHVQQKRGLPLWMLKQHDDAKKKREQALKTRKDTHLKHVIISEKVDKKAEKLHTKTLPFPFTSKEVFEQSIRMPIGPEFNPVSAVGALNRPEVVKKTGVIIKPIKFEEVNPHEKAEEQRRGKKKQTQKKGKGCGGKIQAKRKD